MSAWPAIATWAGEGEAMATPVTGSAATDMAIMATKILRIKAILFGLANRDRLVDMGDNLDGIIW